MAHPYASQAKASQKRRLSSVNAKAGKAYGSSSMYKKSSYPSKNAGSSTPMTISGGSSKKRADRAPAKFAAGGFVGGGGGFGGSSGGKKKGKKKGGATTNIIIASPGGGAGAAPPRAVPVPVPRPVPVPVGGPPVGAVPPRPPMAPPGAGGPPVNVNVPPPAAAGPVGPPPVPVTRPPGMAGGGLIGSTYHNWGKGYKAGGVVKKKANGGGLGLAGPSKPFIPADAPGRPPLLGKSGGPGVPGPGYKKGGAIKGYADGTQVDDETNSSSTSVPAPGDEKSGGGFNLSSVGKALKGVSSIFAPPKTAGGTDPSSMARAEADRAAGVASNTAKGSMQALSSSRPQGGAPKMGTIPGGGTTKFNFNKGGSVKKAGAGSGLGRLAATKRV